MRLPWHREGKEVDISILPMKSCAKWLKNLIMEQDFMKPYLVPGPAGLGKQNVGGCERIRLV